MGVSPEVPVESQIDLPAGSRWQQIHIFMARLGVVFHTHPDAGALAKPCNVGNRWLRTPEKDFQTSQSGDSVSLFVQCQRMVGV